MGASFGGGVIRLAYLLAARECCSPDADLSWVSNGQLSQDRVIGISLRPVVRPESKARCASGSAWRYVLAEGALAGAGLFLYLTYSPADACARFALCALLVCASCIDVDRRIVPDVITVPGMIIGVGLGGYVISGIGVWSSVQGLVGGILIILLVGESYRWLRGREGMGLGDVKLAGMVGAFLGWPGLLFTIIVGSLIGAAGGATVGVVQCYELMERAVPAVADGFIREAKQTDSVVRTALSTALPFAPFFSIAAAVYALFQPQLGRW